MKIRALIAIFVLLNMHGGATDWPQSRFDGTRSSFSPEPLSPIVYLKWVRYPRAKPSPAWKGPDTRMPFDYAPVPVAAEGLVLYGNSDDGKLYVLDSVTGQERWRFYTEAPIRFAPAIWKDRLFLASDDGKLYCLHLRTGRLLWEKQGGPNHQMILGNGALISRWPARGAPTVSEDIVYFGAGIWPSEGIYLYALDPMTGNVLWVNDQSGRVEMDQPHSGARAESGISIQGYPAVGPDRLWVPTGRAMPAAMAKSDGALQYFHLQAQGSGATLKGSGPFIACADGLYFNDDDVFRAADGAWLFNGINAETLVVTPTHFLSPEGNRIRAYRRDGFVKEEATVDRKGAPANRPVLAEPEWTLAVPALDIVSMAAAGRTLVIGTQDRRLMTLDLDARAVVTSATVDSVPRALAIADGRIFIGCDGGEIICFGSQPPTGEEPYEIRFRHDERYIARADTAYFPQAVSKSGILDGYAVDFGCVDGSLAVRLAEFARYKLYAIAENRMQANRVAYQLDKTRYLGAKVMVLSRSLDDTGLPDYFADLLMSQKSMEEGARVIPFDESYRLVKPGRGRIAVGLPRAMTYITRRPLEGIGDWTHQYADAGNTLSSGDALVRPPLRMLWFKDNEFEMPSRHGRGPAPVYHDGRLFVAGLHGILAMDAYNGRDLWTYPIPGYLADYDQEHLNGAAITGGALCIGDGNLYVRNGRECIRLASESGQVVQRYTAPDHPGGGAALWGYLAFDDSILYGSVLNTSHTVAYAYGVSDMSHLYSESDLFFAMSPSDGAVVWAYRPKHSLRNNAIAIADGRVFLIDRPIAVNDRRRGKSPNAHPLGRLVALDQETGEEIWSEDTDIWGTLLAASETEHVLVMAYQSTRFQLNSEVGGRLAAFDTRSGERLWDAPADYVSRPIVNGQTIIAQPGAWDLKTGRRDEDFVVSRSYGCGILTAAKDMLAFRSATLGYLDLVDPDAETENYGGIRPGCWVNAIPAGGLLLGPETTHRCQCSYLIKATIALQPYTAEGP